MVPRPVRYFAGRTRPAPDWIIPGWLKRGNTGFIIGQPKKAGKSWLLLNLAWDLSAGKPLWGITHSKDGPVFLPPCPMRVVYFTQEDAEDDVHDRLELQFQSGRIPNDRFWLVPKDLRMLLDDDQGRAVIQTELDIVVKESGLVDLVLFDPMRRMHRGDENSSEVVSKLWPVLDVIHKRYGCATIFAHHIIKPPTAKGNTFDVTSPFAARGSGDLYGGGDAFINVEPRNTHGRSTTQRLLHLHFETKRGKALTPVELAIDFATGGIVFNGFLP